jgi:hypothetical protein
MGTRPAREAGAYSGPVTQGLREPVTRAPAPASVLVRKTEERGMPAIIRWELDSPELRRCPNPGNPGPAVSPVSKPEDSVTAD